MTEDIVYITLEDETWDMVAKAVYGNEFLADKLMLANPDLLDKFAFSEGDEILCPAFDGEEFDEVPDWRD